MLVSCVRGPKAFRMSSGMLSCGRSSVLVACRCFGDVMSTLEQGWLLIILGVSRANAAKGKEQA